MGGGGGTLKSKCDNKDEYGTYLSTPTNTDESDEPHFHTVVCKH